MTTGAKLFLAAGSLAALAAVVLGAFGAHALKTHLSAEMLAVWHTGVEYHVYHALGLLAVGLVATQPSGIGTAEMVGLADARWNRALLRKPVRARALRGALARRDHADRRPWF